MLLIVNKIFVSDSRVVCFVFAEVRRTSGYEQASKATNKSASKASLKVELPRMCTIIGNLNDLTLLAASFPSLLLPLLQYATAQLTIS